MSGSLNVLSMLKANQTQTPNGTSLNPSANAFGTGADGSVLQQQLYDSLKNRKDTMNPAQASQYGVSFMGAVGRIFGQTR